MTARHLWALLPVLLFAAMAILFGRGLQGDPAKLPSALLNKPVPEFTLPALEGIGRPGLQSADFAKGEVSVVNIFASWCVPCRDEHPLLMRLQNQTDARIVGINYKDDAQNAHRFLSELGQPYDAVGADVKGRAAIDWGVYGVPETFVVDGRGIIRLKFVGPLTDKAINEAILPAIAAAAKN
jgi:cytochrome c biogenesis protein CcmG/thiol:disulfide interchange protein DsbE